MPSPQTPATRLRVLAALDNAADPLAPLWPLSTVIAVNPLWDLRHLPFAEALEVARRTYGTSGYPSESLFREAHATGRITTADLHAARAELGEPLPPPPEGPAPSEGAAADELSAVIDQQVAKWCAAYLHLAGPEARSFYGWWRNAAPRDPAARRLAGPGGRTRLATLPTHPADAVTVAFDRLEIPEAARSDALRAHLVAMPGWAGHAKWRSRWASPTEPGPALRLIDYVAVRLTYQAVLAPVLPTGGPATRRRRRSSHPVQSLASASAVAHPQARPDPAPATPAADVWLTAYENHYRDRLLSSLTGPTAPQPAAPAVQSVFCIDVRSEGLRRHLEATGAHETLGFAGFFGLPMRYQAFGSDEAVGLCPVLIRPTSDLRELPMPGTDHALRRQLTGQVARATVHSAFRDTRRSAVAPFVLAEAGGFLAGPLAAARTLAPDAYATVRRWWNQKLAPPAPGHLDPDTAPAASSMSDQEQALFAQTALTTMGLTGHFAPIVLLCGHGSSTENNPHGTALDCGACGGNRGAASARAAAAVFNRRPVRELLADRGIIIPTGTLFVAGEHDTATDRVTLLDPHLIPANQSSRVRGLQQDLDAAGAALAAERAPELPGRSRGSAQRQAATRSADWAQVQPEWGLARNASFIVGPRSLSARADLQRRAFLHSYDPAVDPDGAALETILTAPMVVGHWISAQYYFSSVDPQVFGAGDKTVHNIVAGIGVTLGAAGDLQVGLPLQSVATGGRLFHEPMRLLTVVQAPRTLLDTVIARNPVLVELFGGAWVHLAARDHEHDNWHLRRPTGQWITWQPTDTTRRRKTPWTKPGT